MLFLSKKTIKFFKNGKLQGKFQELPEGSIYPCIALDFEHDQIEIMPFPLK